MASPTTRIVDQTLSFIGEGMGTADAFVAACATVSCAPQCKELAASIVVAKTSHDRRVALAMSLKAPAVALLKRCARRAARLGARSSVKAVAESLCDLGLLETDDLRLAPSGAERQAEQYGYRPARMKATATYTITPAGMAVLAV